MVLLMTSRAAPRKACSSSNFCLQATVRLICFLLTLIVVGVTTIEAEGSSTWDKTAGKVVANVSDAVILQFIPANESHILTHLALDAERDDIYVGAVNRLYQLNGSNLKPVHQVVTGPRPDSPECHASGCEPNVDKVFTDNYNKVLVVAPSVDAIVACGSVSQGACDKYRLGNLSLHLNYIPKSVAANDPHSSTFAFIGPERYKAWESSDVLYIGTTFTGNGYYRNDVPAMSTRNLYDLNYVELSFLEHSLLRIDVKYRDHFLVQYVYGFNATDYVYFLTVQKKSHLPGQEESGYVTRISRTCISDANYQSYTEITLECLGVDGVNYNLVQDAKLISAGSDLAKSLGVPPGSPVLVTVFLPSEGHTSNPKQTSGVCIFSVKDIEEKFNENIHMCFNGSMQYRNMEYISGPILDGNCPKQGETGNILSFCEVGLKISGPSPIVGKAALRLARTHVTSIQGTSTASHTVVFLGTSEGYLKKILIASAQEAAEYQEIPVDPGHKIMADMRFTKKKDYLLVLSDSKVSKVKVESCSSYTNCSSCLKARDPYCGWCSLEKRCTIQRACQKATFSSPRWLSFGAGQQCIDFEKIDPDRLPIDETAIVELAIRTLPELPSGAKYQCVWGTAPPSDAEVTRAGLKCKTAGRKYRPSIPDEVDHVLVPLSVRSSETNKDFVSRNFAFYDCSRHTTCNTCVRSEWACNWCVYENICTQNTSTCRKSIISGENNPVRLLSHGSSFCPRFWKESSELLAADEARTELVLLAENLPTPRTDQLGFQCVVTIEGATMVVGALLSGPPTINDMKGNYNRTHREKSSTHSLQKVVCAPTIYRYESLVGEYLARVTLVWNRNHVVDGRPLSIYKCGVLGAYRGHQDCSLCVTRPSKYQCSWCGGACKHSLNCSANAQALMQTDGTSKSKSESSFIKQCPTPRIDVIQPLAGPLEGGTLVTIEGSNLGLKEEDIRGGVFIGDVPCEVEDYHVSIRIICRTGPVPKRIWQSPPEQLQFPIVVTTSAGTTQSTVRFAYSNVSISEVWPPLGPVSGGTMLSIRGNFLNVGSQVSAFLDDLPCVVNKTQSSSHRLVCMTSRATPLLATEGVAASKGSASEKSDSPALPFLTKRLVVNIDGAERALSKPFTYMPDPSIFEIKPLRSPWKGGRMLTVHGRYLNAVQVPKITVLLQDHILNFSVCSVLNPSQMECPSPSVDKDFVHALLREKRSLRDYQRAKRDGSSRKTITSYKVSRSPRQNLMDSMALDIGFLMDNVASVRNLKHVLPSSVRSSLVYVPNPSFMGFPNGIKLYKGDTLVIEGEGLNLASDESDVNVTVGTKPCNVTSLALTQLVCSPPEYQPDPTDEMGRNANENFPLVVVRVGRNMRFPIGYLRYEMMKDYQFPPEAIGGMAAGGLFLVLVSMAILVVYRRKSNQAEREYKRIQIQMDTLESNVRSECKQAFAELQTDMTDLTADLESSGIPTLDQRTYVMKVFFPGVVDHPILNDPKIRMNGCRPALENALIEFEQLINNRYFLLTAIDALESQKTFNIRDKVNVASLLVVALTGRMEYLTEILRLLLHRLIEKNVSTKHPQLMLRRAESVIEKMLANWMALCMYNYLKEMAGPSLFLLYKAIKHQVEKGPVDAVTHDARYSLSEERLLREQITHSPVIIHLVRDDPPYEKIPFSTPQTVAVLCEDGEKVTCRVLDCDTITQVKAKILDGLYRNTPHSLRPSVHEVDLEWRHGRNGHLVLADEDMTTKADSNGWRRLNTLAHYGISDIAVMALVPKVQDHHTYNNANCGIKCNSCTGFSRSVSGSPLSFMGDNESGQLRHNVYHLVRPVDHDSPFRGCERGHKAIPEIFLTRLLSTKGTVQKFVDDFFRTILNPNDGLPPAIKWLFDFFDESARRHGITDPEVVLAWKSNSLPLRFWINFIKNPDFILDVHKTPTVDSCLSVIAQTFMDACSTSEHRLGKDSPSNKLLFAKDMNQYRTMVRSFYQGIRELPPVTDQDMAAHLHQLSISNVGKMDTFSALHELFHSYIARYYPQIIEALEVDPECRSLHLAHKLDNIMCTLNGEATSLC